MFHFRKLIFVIMGTCGFFASYSQADQSRPALRSEPKPQDSNAVWKTLLETLNQEPVATKAAESPKDFGHLNEDLLATNRKEMADLKERWNAEAKKIGLPPQGNKARQQRNIFYHEQVQKLNHIEIAKLESFAKENSHSKTGYESISRAIASEVEKNPVTKLESLRLYPEGSQIGFCFGRALMIHYLLLKHGVPQEDIAKIFTIGEIKVGPTVWNFHVAVLVRDPVHQYLVIDPLADGIKPYKEWIEAVIKSGIKGPLSRVRVYATDPRKFLSAFGAYDLKELQDPYLKKYFDQMGTVLKDVESSKL